MLDLGRDQPKISYPLKGPRTPTYATLGAKDSIFMSSNKPPTKSHYNFDSFNEMELQLGTGSKVEDEESGICSPPLWTTSPPKSPHQRKTLYKCLSPASKTQAIARGQRELMEMVKNMPESSYELSLKDLVEHPTTRGEIGEEEKKRGEEKKKLSNKNMHNRRVVDKVKKSGGNIDSGGFYLKMVLPISLGSRKKKNESMVNNNNNNGSKNKVSPRTSVSDGSAKSLDKEWWKRNSLSSSGGESDSGVSSMNSGSLKSSGSSSCSTNSSRCNSRHEMSASRCWPFIPRLESLSRK